MPSDRTPTADTVRDALARGGFPAPVSVPETSLEAEASRYNGLLDPAGAETLGAWLAEALEEAAPSRVLIWQDPDDIVLAHVVARELGVSTVRSFDREGLVAHDGTLDADSRVTLLSGAFRDAESIKAMALLVEQQGATVVAAACLAAVDGPGVRELDAQGIPLIALTDLRTHASEEAAHG